MSDPNVKRCEDYGSFGIETGYTTQRGWYVDRQGRCLGEWTTPDEAAMFAEELYERLRRVTDSADACQHRWLINAAEPSVRWCHFCRATETVPAVQEQK